MPSRLSGLARGLVAGLAFASLMAGARPAAAYEAWLSAMGNGRQDYVGMFDHIPEWARTERKIQVFQVHAGVLHRLSDERLALLLRDLREQHLGFALLTPILDPVPGCPLDESFFFSAPNEDALRVHRLGGRIDFIAFDEPVFFGSQKAAGQRCSMPLPALARAAAPAVTQLHALFPEARFGDVEPTMVPAGAVVTFADALRRASGVPLRFVHADVIWKSDWQAVLPAWRRVLTGAGMRYGVIIDGGGPEGDNVGWAERALARFHAMPPTALEPGDDIAFMSWRRAPADYYPETTPGTMTFVAGQVLGAF